MKQKVSQPELQHSRTGMVLVLVLVVVMLLSFAVYSFSSLMVAEYAATTTGLTQLQRRELVNSGIELAAVAVRQERMGVVRDEGRVRLSQPIQLSLPEGPAATISLLRTVPSGNQKPAYGLRDESAKLNINTLPLEMSRRKEARSRLMALPGITVGIADALLDWMDADDEPSEFGAETSYYTAQSPPRRPRQGPFHDLRELLQVRGISTDLLYGEDQNRNGILDPEENDGDRGQPTDNADGVLQRGLSDYVTLLSCEGTTLANGRRKINLNQKVLAHLFDQLEPVLGTEAATYIVAWRMSGATYLDEPRPDEGEDQDRRRLERLESVTKRLEAQLGNVNGNRPGLSADQTTRGGLTLSDGSMLLKSPLDLFGGQVRVSLDGKDTLLQSPWAADPVTVRRLLPVLEQMVTTTASDVLPGRINVSEASEPVLRSLPELSESAARAIVRMQNEIHQNQDMTEFSSVAWLVSRGLVSMAQLRAMGGLITTHGDVRTGVAIGQTDGHAAIAAAAFMLDCSGTNRRILQLHDLPVMSHTALSLP
jgi:DNA uptake protein ComE-like DNA-binding protein